MSHDRLYSTLSQQLPESVTVVKLPSSGCLVRRDAGTRRSVRKAKINQYFYGSQVFQNTPQALNPSQMVFPLSKLVILRPGGVQISAAMRPIGSTDSSASDGGGKVGVSSVSHVVDDLPFYLSTWTSASLLFPLFPLLPLFPRFPSRCRQSLYAHPRN